MRCSPPTPDSGLSLQALQEASDYAVTDEEAETSEEEAEDGVMEAAGNQEAAGEPHAVPVVVPRLRLRGPRLRVRGPSAAMLAASAAARREREEPLRVHTMPGGGQRPVIAISPPTSPPNIVEPEDSSEESGEEELQVFRAGRRSN